jgi:cytoskeleton protein RodZ
MIPVQSCPGGANQNQEGDAWLKRLREERERRGLSRHQVAQDLHVDEQTIEALEAGRFATFGAPVFARGHLRKYATLLGLNADELLAEFERRSTQPPELVPLTPSAPRLRPEVPVKWLGVATVAAMVLGVAWWALTQPQAPVESAAPAAPPAEVPAPPPVASVAPEPRTVEPPAPAVEERAAPATATGTQVRLRLIFSADSWVELYDAGGQRVFYDLGSANSVRSLTAAAPLRVFLGYTDGVQLELDGQPVALPDEVLRGNIARFSVDAQGQVRPDKSRGSN